MAESIESLQIEISASSQKASKEIERLEAGLRKLSGAIGNLKADNLKKLSDGFREIGSAMSAFGKADGSGLSSIANAMNRLNKADPGRMRELSSAMSALSDGMRSVSGVSMNADGIRGLTESLRMLGSKGAVSGAENLSKLKNSLADFTRGINEAGAVSFDASGLSAVVSSVSRLGGKQTDKAVANLPKISMGLNRFVSGLNSLGSVSFDVSGLSQLVSSISKMGGKTAERAVSNIPKLAAAMKNLMKELSSAPNVSRNVINLANAMAQLSRSSSGIRKNASSFSGVFSSYANSASNASKKTKGLASVLGKLYATYWLVFRGVGKLRDAMDISSQLTEVQNVVDVTFGEFKQKLEDFSATSITDFGISEMTAKKTASRFQAMGTSMGIARGAMADMSIELTKLTADMASFYDEDQSDVARRMWSVFSGETEPLMLAA